MARIEISMAVQLSGWHYDEVGLVPPLVRPSVKSSCTIEQAGFEAHAVTVPTAGACTYLETSGHMLSGGARLVELSAADLVFPVTLLKLGTLADKHLIRRAQLEQALGRRSVQGALLIDTGWERSLNRPGYVRDCPKYHADTLEWFLAQKPSLLGVDVPVMEAESSRGRLLGPLFRAKEMLLLAPVIRLGQLSGAEATLIVLPLAIDQVSGAPCRALVLDGVRAESLT